jgi:iron complex transport system substrate-binding protein
VTRRVRLVAACVALLAGSAAAATPTPAARPSANAPARRIASLNLSADEILVELVSPDRLVAVTAFADDPGNSNIVGRIPKSITRITHAQLERLVELQPDLVIVSDFSDADFLHMLTVSGLRYHRLGGLESMAGIRRAIQGLADAVGESAKGTALVARFDAALRDLDGRLRGAPRPRVLWWNDPDTGGTGTLIDDIITRAGGRNVAAELQLSGVRPVGAERALAADPDFFLVAAGGDRAKLAAHPVLGQARAVKAGHIIEMPPGLLMTLTHYAARSCGFLAHALHPDRVPEPPAE